MTRVCLPLLIDSHACTCAGVGAAKAPVNHARVISEKHPSGSPAWPGGVLPGRPVVAAAGMSPSCLVLGTNSDGQRAPRPGGPRSLGPHFQPPALRTPSARPPL